MKKAILILIVSTFLLFYYMGFLPQEENLPFSQEFFSIESPSATERVWELKKISVASPGELDQLYQLKLDKGIINLPLLSYLLIREAEQSRKRGDIDQAVLLAHASIKFSPDLPQPHFELARVLWHQDHFQFSNILSAFLDGERAIFRHYPSSVNFSFGLVYLVFNAVFLTFMIFGVVVVSKYFPLYFYDIRKRRNQAISSFFIRGLKILLLLVPFFLRLDILWALLYWSILLWGYVTKREKQFLLVFLILLVYLPSFLRSFTSFLESPSLDITLRMYHANHEDWDKKTKERLQEWSSNHPSDTGVLLTLGLMEKRQGRYSQAEKFYKRAIEENPRLSGAFSNLGNVYLAQKKIPLAIASYQQAIDLNPNQGAYHYNLYRAQSQETFLSSQTDKTFQRARQLAPQLIDYYSEIDSPQINRQVIDETITTPGLWRRGLSEFIEKEGWVFWAFHGWFDKIPSRAPFLVPLIFLGFLIGMSSYGQTKRFLSRCRMCGMPTYRLYFGRSQKEVVCFNCYRIFMQNEKLHPRVTEKKSLQAGQFQRQNEIIAKFVSLFLVGFGYLWRDHLFKGVLFLFLFFIFILRFVYWNGVIPSPFVQVSANPWKIIFWEGFFLIFYLFSIWRIYRAKPGLEIEDRPPAPAAVEKELKV
ncbi:MAG: tetratricopeptide repeat protein [Thermodesulfobacteriota bacterium]